MAFFDSKSAYFEINDGGVRNLTSFITSIDGLPGDPGNLDATVLGDVGAQDDGTFPDVTFTIEGLYDDTATTGPEAVLGALWASHADATFAYGPKGSTAGFLKYSGTIKVATFNLTTRVRNKQAFSCALHVQGAVARGTF